MSIKKVQVLVIRVTTDVDTLDPVDWDWSSMVDDEVEILEAGAVARSDPDEEDIRFNAEADRQFERMADREDEISWRREYE